MVLSRAHIVKTAYIFCGFNDGTIVIWKLNWKKKKIVNILLNGHSVTPVKFLISRENRKLVSACLAGDIVYWNIKKKCGIFRIKKAHNGVIKGLIFQKPYEIKSTYILSAGEDGFIKIWEQVKGICIKVIDFLKYDLNNLFFLHENLFLILYDLKNVILCMLKKNLDHHTIGIKKKIQIKKPENLSVFSKFEFLINYQKKKIELAYIDKKSFLNKLENKEIARKKKLNSHVSFSTDGNIFGIDLFLDRVKDLVYLLVQYHDPEAVDLFKFSKKKFIECPKEVKITRICRKILDNHKSGVRDILWHSNDRFILALCSVSKNIYNWHLKTRKCVNIIKTLSKGLCIDLFDLNSFLIGTNDGNIEIYDFFTGKLIWKKINAHFGPIWNIQFSKNTSSFYSGGSDGILRLWQIETNEIVLSKKLFVRDKILLIKSSQKNNFLILTGISSNIWIFDLSTFQFCLSLQGHSLPIISLEISQNCGILFSGSLDNTLRIWNILDKNLIKLISLNNSIVTTIVIQPSSPNFFTGSKNGLIKYWDGKIYCLLTEVNFHQKVVLSLKFSESERFIASCSKDKLIAVWKFVKEREIKNTLPSLNPISNDSKLKKLLQTVCENEKKRSKAIRCYIYASYFIYRFFEKTSKSRISNLTKYLTAKEIGYLLNTLVIILDSEAFFDISFILQNVCFFIMNLNKSKILKKNHEIFSRLKKRTLFYISKNENINSGILDHIKNFII